jgi:hypothetical protein
MIKTILTSCAIALCIGIACFAIFLAGMYQAPEPAQRDQMDELQSLCDLSRKEPWRADIKVSCDFMQEFWALEYKCEKIRGCYTVKASSGEVRY